MKITNTQSLKNAALILTTMALTIACGEQNPNGPNPQPSPSPTTFPITEQKVTFTEPEGGLPPELKVVFTDIVNELNAKSASEDNGFVEARQAGGQLTLDFYLTNTWDAPQGHSTFGAQLDTVGECERAGSALRGMNANIAGVALQTFCDHARLNIIVNYLRAQATYILEGTYGSQLSLMYTINNILGEEAYLSASATVFNFERAPGIFEQRIRLEIRVNDIKEAEGRMSSFRWPDGRWTRSKEEKLAECRGYMNVLNNLDVQDKFSVNCVDDGHSVFMHVFYN